MEAYESIFVCVDFVYCTCCNDKIYSMLCDAWRIFCLQLQNRILHGHLWRRIYIKKLPDGWVRQLLRVTCLFVGGPFDELLERGLFAVHEYAHAVDFGGEPYHEEEGGVKQDQRCAYLPERYVERYAHHHQDGGDERYH